MEPGKGIHKPHIGPIAVVDMAITFIVSILIAFYFNLNPMITFFSLWAVGIATHFALNIETGVNRTLRKIKS